MLLFFRRVLMPVNYKDAAGKLKQMYFDKKHFAADAAVEAEEYRKSKMEAIIKTPMHISGDFPRKMFATNLQFVLAHMTVAIESRFTLANLGGADRKSRDFCIYMMEGFSLALMWRHARTGTPVRTAEEKAISFCHSLGRSLGLSPDDSLEASKKATFWYSMLASAVSRDNAEALAFMRGPTPKLAGG